MTFGLTIEKLLLIGLIAVMIIGPERLPAAAESLRRTIQQARRMARTAQERMREDLGPEVADVDWQRLDPRQYDPRRIIREALLAEPDAPAASTSATPPGPPAVELAPDAPPPAAEPVGPPGGAPSRGSHEAGVEPAVPGGAEPLASGDPPTRASDARDGSSTGSPPPS